MAAAAPFVQLRRVLTFIPSALDDKAGLALRDVQWLAVELQDIKAALTEPKYRVSAFDEQDRRFGAAGEDLSS